MLASRFRLVGWLLQACVAWPPHRATRPASLSHWSALFTSSMIFFSGVTCEAEWNGWGGIGMGLAWDAGFEWNAADATCGLTPCMIAPHQRSLLLCKAASNAGLHSFTMLLDKQTTPFDCTRGAHHSVDDAIVQSVLGLHVQRPLHVLRKRTR